MNAAACLEEKLKVLCNAYIGNIVQCIQRQYRAMHTPEHSAMHTSEKHCAMHTAAHYRNEKPPAGLGSRLKFLTVPTF